MSYSAPAFLELSVANLERQNICCLWVSGRHKGRGLGRELLAHCLEDAGERHGVVAVSGNRPYLTSTRFFLHHGFERVERTATGFDLVCFRASEAAATRCPRWRAAKFEKLLRRQLAIA